MRRQKNLMTSPSLVINMSHDWDLVFWRIGNWKPHLHVRIHIHVCFTVFRFLTSHHLDLYKCISYTNIYLQTHSSSMPLWCHEPLQASSDSKPKAAPISKKKKKVKKSLKGDHVAGDDMEHFWQGYNLKAFGIPREAFPPPILLRANMDTRSHAEPQTLFLALGVLFSYWRCGAWKIKIGEFCLVT